MNDSSWISVFNTAVHYQAEIVKQMLESNGIEAVVVNKQDSSYPMLGEAEVFVDEEFVSLALKLIEDIEN